EATPCLLRSSELASLAGSIDKEGGSLVLKQMLIPPRIQHAGRWIKQSSSCRSFNRLEVDSDGFVRCCRFAPPIGRVGDSKEMLHTRLTALVMAVEQVRKCESCSVTECPRCPFPGMDDCSYCETVKQCTSALKAVQWIHLFSRLVSLVETSTN